jgi:L-threonylcarbamoyladenylate synthase
VQSSKNCYKSVMTRFVVTIQEAAQHLRASKLVAFPTETVYGLGALAHESFAVAKIYATKGRPSHNPLIVHVSDKAMALRYGIFNEVAHCLADAFFPAPLALVLPAVESATAHLVRAGGDTVALRSPSHPVAQALIAAVGHGIAAPSANRSGKISPTCAAHVYEEFAHLGDAAPFVLDGGATLIGIESTVVKCSHAGVHILRQGSITEAMLTQHVPVLAQDNLDSEALLSPGLLAAHYAPDALLRLNATSCSPHEALIAFGGNVPACKHSIINLSADARLDEAAAGLYNALRTLDKQYAHIAVMPIPNEGIGAAINDRLNRAAYRK